MRSANLYFLDQSEGGSSDSYDKSLAAAFEWSHELSQDFSVENSSQGLLCVRSKVRGWAKVYNDVWMLNPFTGEYIILPFHLNTKYFYRCGIGSCPNTNQYKIISIFYNGDTTRGAEVNTNGSAEWRNIVVPKYKYYNRYNWVSFTDVYVNGSIYWLIMDSSVADSNVCF